jgi:hypothetical protein
LLPNLVVIIYFLFNFDFDEVDLLLIFYSDFLLLKLVFADKVDLLLPNMIDEVNSLILLKLVFNFYC